MIKKKREKTLRMKKKEDKDNFKDNRELKL